MRIVAEDDAGSSSNSSNEPSKHASQQLMDLGVTPYAILTTLAWAWMYSHYLSGINFASLTPAVRAYTLASFWAHFIVLCLAAALIGRAVARLAGTRVRLATVLVGTLGALGSAWLFVDSRIYSIVSLHVNRFVLEAMLQPKAMSHIGIDPWSVALASWPILLVLAPHVFILRLSRPRLSLLGRRGTSVLLVLVAGALLVDKLAYGYFYFKGAPFVFELKSAVPIYPTLPEYHVTKIYERILGQESKVGFMQRVAGGLRSNDTDAGGRFRYPAAPIEDAKLERPLNIIFIVAESLRANDFDRLSAPYLTALGDNTQFAMRHFSSSNCTHLGIFSLLYGLNPWYFQDARMNGVPPVGIRLLQYNGYDMFATLSRTMQWYDLDLFVFDSRFSSYEPDLEDNVARDRAVTKRAIEIAKHYANSEKRYFNFVYYYSTHADYQHPEDGTVFQPELKGRLDLANPAMRDDRVKLVNRYRNAIHFVDGEVKQLVEALKGDGLWNSTLLVFTGDHGEEFYEDNKLGHNSSLNRFQTQVPLLLHIPGEPPRRIEKSTSHTDVFQTLLQVLGAPAEIFANFQGLSLLAPEPAPIFVGMAHYQRPEKFAVIDRGTKVVVDVKDGFPQLQGTTDLDGKAIQTPDSVDAQVLTLLQQFRQFRRPASEAALGAH